MKKPALIALSVGLCFTLAAPSFAVKMSKAKTISTEKDTMQQATAPVTPDLKLVKTLTGEDSFSILRPTFSKDGRFLAANLNETKSVRIWDTKTGEVVGEVPVDLLFGPTQLVDGIEFTPDNDKVVVFRAGYPLKEVDWRKKAVTRTLDLGINGPKIEDYAFCPMFKMLVLATPNGIDVWDYQKGQKVSHLLDGQYINSIDISSDARWVVFAKRGPVQESVGLIDAETQKVSKYPLANLNEEDQKRLPNYQVRHVSFEPDGRNILVGYMALPEGQFRPTGPAGVFRVDIENGRFSGPKTLSSNMLSFDPVALGKPFHTTFINTFTMGTDKIGSAVDFVSPDLNIVKTLTDADLKAPLLTFRISPDQKWMAGSFKEPDGKVRVRLYEIAPSNSATAQSEPGSIYYTQEQQRRRDTERNNQPERNRGREIWDQHHQP